LRGEEGNFDSMTIRMGLVAGMLALAGCSTTGSNGSGPDITPKSGPDSASVAATVLSEMGGGLISGNIGANLSATEKRKALEAEYKALEYTASGQTVTWKSDQSSRYGEVVAAQPYRVGSQDCRQYRHTVYSGGAGQIARGTACRNSDGSWTPLT
jgi:surface antigen